MTTDYVSPLAAAINARVRKVHEFDLTGLISLPPGAPSRVGIRVPTKGEQDEAIMMAYRAIETKPYDKEIAKSDEDILRDMKVVHILWKACVYPELKQKPDGSGAYYDPAFPAPSWMCARFKTEEIAALLNLLNEVRAAESSEPRDLDESTLDSLHAVAVSADGLDMATEFLAGCGREFMVRLYVAEAKRLAGARDALNKAQEEIHTLKSSPASTDVQP